MSHTKAHSSVTVPIMMRNVIHTYHLTVKYSQLNFSLSFSLILEAKDIYIKTVAGIVPMENIEVKCLTAVAISWNQTWHLESQPDFPGACLAYPLKIPIDYKEKTDTLKLGQTIQTIIAVLSFPTFLQFYTRLDKCSTLIGQLTG